MSGDIMPDPPAENIMGEKKVVHHFRHGIDWKVNVSHVLAGVAVLVAAYWLFWSGDSDSSSSSSEELPDDQDDDVEIVVDGGGLLE